MPRNRAGPTRRPRIETLSAFVNTAEAISIFDYASIVYALDLAGLVAILGLFTHMLTIEKIVVSTSAKDLEKE